MPAKKKKIVKQEIVIVIDKSGSMAQSREDVIGGFNTYINDLKREETIDAKLTLVMFDNSVHKLYSGKNIQDVGELCTKTYSPNGGTALNDAVMEAINDVDERLKKSSEKEDVQVLLVVFTDGEENSSRKYTDKDKIKQTRESKEKEGWAFIFMGADMDAWSSASSYGISAANTVGIGRDAIAVSASYLSNRTRKAATLHASHTSGQLPEVDYSASMQSLMSLDEDDMKNDAEAVRLRETLDSSNVKKLSPAFPDFENRVAEGKRIFDADLHSPILSHNRKSTLSNHLKDKSDYTMDTSDSID